MKKNESPLIVTNVTGTDIPEGRLLQQRRPADRVPTIAFLERKKRDGKFDLQIAIRGLTRKDVQHARGTLNSMANQFKYVPEDELYSSLFPETRTVGQKKRIRK